ncbi:MAG: repeat containing protein, partial [Cyanobacteria bacterium RYN_339]|nr:repeat containing protein [Cyanobacteria bacterium RYN_339]
PTATPTPTPDPTTAPTPIPTATPVPPTPTPAPASGSTWGFSGGGSPFALAVDVAQNIWVTNDGNTMTVTKNDLNGTRLGSKVVGTNAHDLAVQSSNQRVWVTVNGDGLVTVFDPTLTQVMRLAPGINPEGIAFDANENAWVCDASGGRLLELDSQDGHTIATHSFHNVNAKPRHILFDGQGNAWVSLNGANQVVRIAPDGSELRVDTDAHPSRLALDDNGNVWVTCTGTDIDLLSTGEVPGHTVMRINPTCTNAIPFQVGNSPYGISKDPAGNILVVNSGSNSMMRLDANTGAALQTYGNLGSPASHPFNVAMNNAGFAWLTLFSDNILLKMWP